MATAAVTVTVEALSACARVHRADAGALRAGVGAELAEERALAPEVHTVAATAAAITAETVTAETVTAEAVTAEAEAVTAETVTAEAEAAAAEAAAAEAVTAEAAAAEAAAAEAVTAEAAAAVTAEAVTAAVEGDAAGAGRDALDRGTVLTGVCDQLVEVGAVYAAPVTETAAAAVGRSNPGRANRQGEGQRKSANATGEPTHC
jgi:hypothetical protein